MDAAQCFNHALYLRLGVQQICNECLQGVLVPDHNGCFMTCTNCGCVFKVIDVDHLQIIPDM